MFFLLFGYLAIVNSIGFYVMYLDKKQAIRGGYRIPEATLWKIALIGGAGGTTLGMKLFRHKTRHLTFKLGFSLILIVQLFLFVYFLY